MPVPNIDPGLPADDIGLEHLYTAQHERIRGYLQRIVDDRATAEDLVQDTFVKALRGWSGRDPAASASAWLYRIATNTAYDELRRRRRALMAPILDEERPPAVTPSFDTHVAEADAVRRALADVPDVFRAPLLLHLHGGHRIDEIAGQFNVAPGTVKSRLHRGRAHFRRAYDGSARGRQSMPDGMTL